MGGGCRGGHAIWGSGIGDGRGGRAIWGLGLVPPETAGTERILLALPDSGAHWCWRVAPDALLNNDRRRLHAGQHGHAVTQYRLQLRAGIHQCGADPSHNGGSRCPAWGAHAMARAVFFFDARTSHSMSENGFFFGLKYFHLYDDEASSHQSSRFTRVTACHKQHESPRGEKTQPTKPSIE